MTRTWTTKASLHLGICRRCAGTGEVPRRDAPGRTICPGCAGEGALR